MGNPGIRQAEDRVRSANRLVAGLSVVLAAIAWMAIRDAISNEHLLRDVPIVVRAAEGLTVLDLSSDTVDIRFRGARSDLALLDRERERVMIEVDAATLGAPGELKTIKLVAANVRNPSSARPVRIEPDELSFTIDREGEQSVPVRAEVTDELPEGFEVVSMVCTPETVLLKGPLAQIRGVEAVRTLPIDLQGRVQSFRARGTVLPPAHLTGARVDPDRVVVEVTILERSAVRQLTNVPVRILSAAGVQTDARPEPAVVQVNLQGRSSALDAMDAAAVWAFVDAGKAAPGEERDLTVKVYLPAGVRLHSVEPPIVRVRMNE